MTSPKALSDKALLARTSELRRCEHAATIEILTHLNEIELRRLHLTLGYGSLFDYCTRSLGYSASAAGRRIQAARAIKQHPDILVLLQRQTVTIMTVSIVASILTPANKQELLVSVSGKTQREVEAIASRYRPPVALRDRVVPVRVHVRTPVQNNGNSDELFRKAGRSNQAISVAPATSISPATSNKSAPECPDSQCGSDSGPSMANNLQEGISSSSIHSRPGSKLSPTPTEQKLLIQFLAGEDFMEKYEKARSLLSQRLPDTSFANVFEALIGDFLERHSPERKKARRDAKVQHASIASPKRSQPAPGKQHARNASSKRSQPAPGNKDARPDSPEQNLSASTNTTIPRSRSRHIPTAIRDQVFARDKGRLYRHHRQAVRLNTGAANRPYRAFFERRPDDGRQSPAVMREAQPAGGPGGVRRSVHRTILCERVNPRSISKHDP